MNPEAVEPTVDDTSPRGRGIMVSYKELVEIRVGMQRLESMLLTTLALKGTVDDHALRITALEQGRNIKNAEFGVWKTILVYGAGIITSALGGGALAYLPQFFGH